MQHVAILDLLENHGLKNYIHSNYGEDKVKFYKCDVTKSDDVDRALGSVVAEHGFIDGVMNYAGICNDQMYAEEININLVSRGERASFSNFQSILNLY